jgi:hypothetical protein
MAKIKVSKELFIEIEDGYNFVLKQKKVITGESGRGRKAKEENIGKMREVTLGYFPNLQSAVQSIVRQSLTDLDSKRMEDIKECLQIIESCMKEAAKFDSKFMMFNKRS